MIQSAVKIRAFRWALLCLFWNSCMKTPEVLSLVHICIHSVNIRSPCDSLSFVFHRPLSIHYQPFSGYVLHRASIPQLHPSLSLPAANPLVFSQFRSFLFYLSPFFGLSLKTLITLKVPLKIHVLSSPLRVVLHWHRWIEHSTLSKIVLQTFCVSLQYKMYVFWLLKSFK